jgi:8-oxo-dGTP diphosphatase
MPAKLRSPQLRAEGTNVRASRYREIACAVMTDNRGRFLLQQRDDIVGILHPGKVGLFGGHREGDETFLDCVVREIHEEIGYFVPAERFEYLASLVGGDIDIDGTSVREEVFAARGIPVHELVVTEGALLVADPLEMIEIDHMLTPSTRYVMKAFGVPGF